MSITFRIATDEDDRDPLRAVISARQLAAFRVYLREESVRLRMVLIDPEEPQEAVLAYSFEARVCPVALATISRLFDYDVDVITVVEEAQFRSRRISVYRADDHADIVMRVAFTSDLGLEMNLANGNAYALLESVGLSPDSVGEIPLAAIRSRLSNPAVQRRAQERGTADYLNRLDQLLASATANESARLEWA